MSRTLSYLLYLGAVVSGVLCVYRLMVLMLYIDLTNPLLVGDNVSLIAFLASMTLWCWKFGSYTRTPDDPLTFYFDMKTLSFVAGIVCLVHFCTSLLYFMHMMSINLVTLAYICGELALWLILGAFLISFSFYSKKNAENFTTIANEFGGIQV